MWCSIISLALSAFSLVQAQTSLDDIDFSGFTPSTTLKSTGLTDSVQWDGYSLFVNHERALIFSGEIHPFRLPVPGLYKDVMQKIKALGFNTVSFYTLWGLHNPAEGSLDFDGWKNLQPFIDAANESGLWMIARPGPYIDEVAWKVNAEITGGGIPGWVTALNSTLRTADPGFKDAYAPYWEAVGKTFAANQISRGGPIIAVQVENEYYLNSDGDIDTQYVQDLESSMRSFGVEVPFTFNDASKEGRLVAGQGAVNIYGFDSYPQSADCSQPYEWPYQVDTTYRPFLQNTTGRAGEPFTIPEFQAGTTPIVGQVGFENCLPLYSAEYERVFYLSALAQNLKIINLYMIYGGTNWGHLAFPRAITTYDYWAPIREDRSLNEPKYSELKLIAHFLESSNDFAKTWIVGSDNFTYTSLPGNIQVDELRNPDTDAGFYIVRQANSSSISKTSFELDLRVWNGNVTVPVTLNGRDSRIVVSNYCWGASCLSYSSAAIMTSATIGQTDVLVVYGDPDQVMEIGLPDDKCVVEKLSGDIDLTSHVANGRTVINYLSSAGHTVVQVDGGARRVIIHIVDTITAYSGWKVSQDSESSLIFGPYLVRSACGNGSTLDLTGDVNVTTPIEIHAAEVFTGFTWNQSPLHVTQGADRIWRGEIDGPPRVVPSQITNWTHADSLPEIEIGFDDSSWVVANKTFTVNPNVVYPDYTGIYNLYMQDYGFFVGSSLFRGHFVGTGNETGIDLSLSPGTNGAGAVWINGEYIGAAFVSADGGVEDVNATFQFPAGVVQSGSKNVITIVLDNTGLEETDQFSGTPEDIKSPRGIRGYSLIGGKGLEWRVQGNLGGNTDFPDKTRGIYNTGGLYGERQGWHLPGDPNGSWEAGGPGGSPGSAPGVMWYRGQVETVFPQGLDVHYSFVFPNSTGAFRAQLFVNGWQYGRRFGDAGPQLAYPIPPGILENGTNTIALSVLSLNGSTADLGIGASGLRLQVDRAISTSLDLSALGVVSPSIGDIHG